MIKAAQNLKFLANGLKEPKYSIQQGLIIKQVSSPFEARETCRLSIQF